MNIQYKSLFPIIKKAVINNIPYVIINVDGINMSVLKLLQSQGIIQSFEIRGQLGIISMKHVFWKGWGKATTSLLSIKKFTRLNKRHSISAKQFIYRNKISGEAYIHIINTDLGVQSNYSSSQHVGGIPIAKVL